MASAAPDLQSPRTGPRKRVLLRGTLFTPEGAFVIWIRDISATEALISCKDRLPVGCDVIFKRGTVFAAAQVELSDDTGVCVKFYRELGSQEIEAATVALPNQN